MEMNIILGSSSNYLAYTATTIASVCRHMAGGGDATFHVMHAGDVTRSDEELFRANLDRCAGGARIEFVEVRDRLNLAEKISTSAHIKGAATYLRMYIPDLFQGKYSRVVYLDSDLVVCRDIRELFETDMQGQSLAGVEDFVSLSRLDALWLPATSRYVNAGVLVWNLDAIDRPEMRARLEGVANGPVKHMISAGDQDLLALIFHDRLLYLDPRWNAMILNNIEGRPLFLERAGKMSGLTRGSIADSYRNPFIIHYVGDVKPWSRNCYYDAMAGRWHDYAKLTGYYGDALKRIGGRVRSRAAVNRAVDCLAFLPQTLGLRYCYAVPSSVLDGSVPKRRTWFARQAARDRIDGILSRNAEKRIGEEFVVSGKGGIRTPHPLYHLSQPVNYREYGFKSLHRLIFQAASFSTLADGKRSETGTILLDASDLPLSEKQAGLLEAHREAGARILMTEPGPVASILAPCPHMRIPVRFRRSYSVRLDDLAFGFDTRIVSRFGQYLESAESVIDEPTRKRCREAIGFIVRNRLTVVNSLPPHSTDAAMDDDEYVLVIDQETMDPAVLRGRADKRNFSRMLQTALDDNPGSEIRVYLSGGAKGHIGSLPKRNNLRRIAGRHNPYALLEKAKTVYTCNSHMGFEALLAGKQVVAFADSFYSGRGLTDDRGTAVVRGRNHDIEELFHCVAFRNTLYFSPFAPEMVQPEQMLEEMVALRDDFFRWAGQWK